ncbi:MAG: hypothetical protein KF749_05825 [Bacteroidetes bacterium]|nr:hypothetical protein [Bacteroidota bacterium]MCW5894697.1 hypothetical protein [Bacteroidota bacterium]
MNLEEQILKEHSKHNTVRIARWVGSDKKRFKQLMDLFLKGEYRVTQRSAWIVSHCADEHPVLLLPYLNKMIDRMMEPDVHVAARRNVVRLLQNIEVPPKLAGKVATICFELLASRKEPVAVKCFCMTVLGNIAKQEPDLGNEIRLIVEQQIPWGTAGFRARAKKVLKGLDAH